MANAATSASTRTGNHEIHRAVAGSSKTLIMSGIGRGVGRPLSVWGINGWEPTRAKIYKVSRPVKTFHWILTDQPMRCTHVGRGWFLLARLVHYPATESSPVTGQPRWLMKCS